MGYFIHSFIIYSFLQLIQFFHSIKCIQQLYSFFYSINLHRLCMKITSLSPEVTDIQKNLGTLEEVFSHPGSEKLCTVTSFIRLNGCFYMAWQQSNLEGLKVNS